MNKRYMDFVPSKASKSATGKLKQLDAPAKVVKKPSVASVPANKPAASKRSAGGFSIAGEVKLGLVEDLNKKFVKSDVPKRPLSKTGRGAKAKAELKEAKAKKIGGIRAAKTVKAPVEKPVEKVKANSSFKTPFINQEKVTKRPLSKNVYQKEIVVPKEEPKGPVTIISKTDKDAHVSLIITIILTIILGAAAGTAAFLLLPK